MQLNTTRVKPSSTGSWAQVVRDTEAEIQRLERRLEGLKLALRGAQVQIANGVPFPGEQGATE
jgi:hypothetical protein